VLGLPLVTLPSLLRIASRTLGFVRVLGSPSSSTRHERDFRIDVWFGQFRPSASVLNCLVGSAGVVGTGAEADASNLKAEAEESAAADDAPAAPEDNSVSGALWRRVVAEAAAEAAGGGKAGGVKAKAARERPPEPTGEIDPKRIYVGGLPYEWVRTRLLLSAAASSVKHALRCAPHDCSPFPPKSTRMPRERG
jgi:hypothetical protein